MMNMVEKPSGGKFKFLLGLVSLLVLSSSVTAQQQIKSANVLSSPSIVGAQSATLSVLFYSEAEVPKGGFVKIEVPPEASILTGRYPCMLTGYDELAGLTCNGERNSTLTFELPTVLEAMKQSEFIFKNVFNAPRTSLPTSSFKITLLDVDEVTVIAETDTDVTLSSLNFAQLQGAAVTQTQSIVVGDVTPVFFTVTTLNPIPPGGSLRINLPKWNMKAPAALRKSYLVQDEDSQDPLCAPKFGVADSLECFSTISSQEDVIFLRNAFPEGRNAGDTFSFYVNRLRNPLSMSSVAITIQTGISVNNEIAFLAFDGEIDAGPALFTPQEAAQIDPEHCQVTAEKETVQEFSDFFIPFKVPMPVEDGCIILLYIPEDFTVDEGNLVVVKGWGIFGATKALNFEVDENARTIKIVDQCEPYSTDGLSSTIKLTKLKNPDFVKPSASFRIYVHDKNSELIAKVEALVEYTPSPGTVRDIEIVPVSGKEIGITSNVRLQFTPVHKITEDSFITVKMPDLLPASCDLIYTEGMKTAPTCFVLPDNTFKFNKPFVADIYNGGLPLVVAFKDLKLPPSSRMIQGIHIKTYQMIEDQDYLVDSLVDDSFPFFAPDPVLFLFSTVQPGSIETYSNTNFTFSNTLANHAPEGSKIFVTIPPEIRIDSKEDVESSCQSVKNLQSDLNCTLSEPFDGQYHMVVTGGFGPGGLDALEEFSFKISKGLLTPISTQTSSTFKLELTDSEGYKINYIEKALTITMRDGKDVGPLEIEAGNYTVGEKSYHMVTFTTPVPLYDGYKLYIYVPEACDPPMELQLSCRGLAPLAQNLQCRVNGQRITIEIMSDMETSLTQGGTGIQQGDQIRIFVSPISNPTSLMPSQNYRVSIRSEALYEVARQFTPGSPIIMQDPSDIKIYNFEALDLRQNALTTVTITWVNTQEYPIDLSLIIHYDSTQITPKLDEDGYAPCIYKKTHFVTCEFKEDYIIVSKILTAAQEAGQEMEITINQMIINVEEPLVTNSWKLTSYRNEGQYAIDEIKGDMTFSFDCEYPCLQCDPGQPSVCTECNTVNGYAILYENECYEECPAGTYFENYECKLCDPKCKTCTKTSSLQCTSCDPDSEWPFLNGNTCSPTCDFGFYGNSDSATCEKCDYPCESCSGTADHCLSCFSTGVEKFAFDNKCMFECPYGFVAPVEEKSFDCMPCSSNCETCESSQYYCSTCPEGDLLNLNDQSCVNQCPAGITVFMQEAKLVEETGELVVDEFCQVCDSKCSTCKDELTFCTSCQKNLSLEKSTGECRLDCDIENFLQVSVNGECKGCSSGCKTCQGTQDHCLSCFPGTYFYNNDCVTVCPTIEGYRYEPNDDGLCVIPGLKCPFGYRVTPSGDGCELKAQICEPGDRLNYDKTKCIPGSTGWVPLPILTCCIVFSIIPIVSKIRNRESRIFANLIAVWAFFEAIAIIVQVCLANSYGIKPVTSLTLVALVFHYAINLFFSIIYVKQVQHDQAFKHWMQYNKKVQAGVAIVGGCFNFKCYRLLYSRLFGMDEFNAPLEEPYTFYRPFNLSSLFNLVCVKLPLIVACIFGLMYVEWGYQLLIVCFELLVIEVFLLILSMIEYFKLRAHLMKQGKYTKVDPKKVDKLAVMAGFDDFDESDIEEDNIDSKHRKNPKSLRVINQMEGVLSKIISRQHANAHCMDTVKEIDFLHEQEIMERQFRRCKSFRLNRPTVAEAWGDSDDEYDDGDRYQNYISEPASPRSKEMLHNGFFVSRMAVLHKVYTMRDQYDNCYREAVDPHSGPMRDVKLVSKKVQTNVLELLGVDDLFMAESPRSMVSGDSDRFLEEGMDSQAAGRLINGVIDNLDTDGLGEFKRRRKRLPKRRMAEIPNFDIEEILGEFEIDNKGNNMIIKTKDGKLNDKNGRLVNRRGYLLDPAGNVITRRGIFIFYKEEIDHDDEIPAPFCFEKKKNTLFRVEAFTEFRKQQKKDRLAMQDDFIEREYRRLKEESKVQKRIARQHRGEDGDSPRSSVESLMGETPAHYNARNKQGHAHHQEPANRRLAQKDEDDFINQIVEPVQAKSKGELLGINKSSNASVNKSQKRSGSSHINTFVSATASNLASKHSELINVRSESDINQTSALTATQQLSNANVDTTNQQSYKDLMFNEDQKNDASQNFNDVQRRSVNSQHRLRGLGSKKANRPRVTAAPAPDMLAYMPGQDNLHVYNRDMKKIEESFKALKNDEEFIRKMNKFNQQLNKKKMKFNQDQLAAHRGRGGATAGVGVSGGKLNNLSHSPYGFQNNLTVGGPQSTKVMRADSADKKVGLAHRNLNQVYGRVRTKFNRQIKQTGAALKFQVHVPRNQSLLPEEAAEMRRNLSQGGDIKDIGFIGGHAQMSSSKRPPQGRGSALPPRIPKGQFDAHKLQELQSIYSNNNKSDPNASAAGGLSHTLIAANNSSGGVHHRGLQHHAFEDMSSQPEFIDPSEQRLADQVSQVQHIIDHQNLRLAAQTSAGNSARQTKTQEGGAKNEPIDLLHGKYL